MGIICPSLIGIGLTDLLNIGKGASAQSYICHICLLVCAVTPSGSKPSASSVVDKFTGSNFEFKPINPWTFSIFAIYEEMLLPLSECGQDIAPSQTCTFKPELGNSLYHVAK